MTENMAGRGEGLAGLREALQTRIAHLKANSEHWQDINERLRRGESVTVMSSNETYHDDQVSFLEKALTALEAAAPPSTPALETLAKLYHAVSMTGFGHDVKAQKQRLADALKEAGTLLAESFPPDYAEACAIEGRREPAALATPSPQPILLQDFNAQFGVGIFVVTGEHQRTAFFSKEKAEQYLAQQDPERFRIVVYPKPPAATQEPAGSGATNEHELLVGGVVRAALELAILRGDLRMDSGDAFEEMSDSEREDVISDTWNAMNGEGTCDDEPVKELKAIYVALGSPRKVGEDGQSATKIWTCKIGEITQERFANLPNGLDFPMRVAIKEAYERITGKEPNFCFSGWGGALTEGERAVVENRPPNRSSSVPVGEQK